MENILHSVYLKHSTSFKSLTKQALAQIILKIIYQNGDKGIRTQIIRRNLEKLTGVKFETRDIDDALIRLKNVDGKVNSKSGRHFIKHDYKKNISEAVEESKNLHKEIIEFWFSKSETYISNTKKIEDWLKNLLIYFFKDYSYDWVRDLKPNRNNGKKKTPNIELLIDNSFLNSEIIIADRVWLKKQFIKFLESARKSDNDLLWIYGSSMFSATLITARNYADEFSLELFKDADFILDTNILMILELEGFEKNYALEAIEETFVKLNISPKFLKISQDEYLRTIGPKRDSTIASVEKYDFEVIKELDCNFIQTALMRQCKNIEDFKEFFTQISDIPNYFHHSLELKREDYSELVEAIELGENDNELKNGINKIYKRRTNRDKRERPKQHDAGLYRGVEYLNKSKKTMILTRDNVLKEFAFENAPRDDYPLAIGLDSLIQMMAINSGGSDINSTNFAPLFSKLVKSSLFPEKETFKPEDLDFILQTKIQISELSKEKVLEIAKVVNKLRMKGIPYEDITLEIQRSFNVSVSGFTDKINELKSQKHQIESDQKRASKEKGKLESELFNDKYHISLNKIRNKIFQNWLKLFGLIVLLGGLLYFVFHYSLSTSETINILFSISISVIASLLITLIGFKFKLFITKKDKLELNNVVIETITKLKMPSN